MSAIICATSGVRQVLLTPASGSRCQISISFKASMSLFVYDEINYRDINEVLSTVIK